MFSYLTQLLSEFQSKPVKYMLLSALAMLISAVVLASFLQWLKRRKQERPDNWVGLITGSSSNVLKVLTALIILAALGLHLRFSAGEFVRLRGGTSERNYEAVKLIWGRPHMQREFRVHLARYTKKYYDKDGLEYDVAKLEAASQPVARREVIVEEILPNEPVAAAVHNIQLTKNPRPKGNALYPGFDLACTFTYVLENTSDKAATAKCVFPLPSNQGLVQGLTVHVDGGDVTGKTAVNDDSLCWTMAMEKDQKVNVRIAYASRGLEYVRIEPGSGRQLRTYRITMDCRGIAKADLDYPIGCMTPTDPKETPDGTQLAWNLDNAVTRLGMGVIVPKEKQEGYYVGKVLQAAPWGLMLLLAIVLVSHLAAGRPIRYVPLLLLAVGFHLYYLLMANIGDYWPGLTGGMAIAGVVLTGLMALLWFKLTDRFAAASTIVFFMLFCFAYPLFSISDYQNLLLSGLYVSLLGYVVVLLVARRRQVGGDAEAVKADAEVTKPDIEAGGKAVEYKTGMK